MVDVRRMAVVVIEHGRRLVGTAQPPWAIRLEDKIDTIYRRIIRMALDASISNRIQAGAAALVEQSTRVLAENVALKNRVAELSSAADADALSDAEANRQFAQLADKLDALLKGPETPVVATPTPEEAPAVVEGSSEPEVVSEEPAQSDEAPVNVEQVLDNSTGGGTPQGDQPSDPFVQ